MNHSRITPPGATLFDLLEERGMTQAELAESTGRPLKTINGIIAGKIAITSETASQLERVLGPTAEFWSQREANYRAAHLVRLPSQKEHLIDKSMGLERITLRLPTTLMDSLKSLAKKKKLNPKAYIRQLLLLNNKKSKKKFGNSHGETIRTICAFIQVLCTVGMLLIYYHIYIGG